jgi:hypothetical protein
MISPKTVKQIPSLNFKERMNSPQYTVFSECKNPRHFDERYHDPQDQVTGSNVNYNLCSVFTNHCTFLWLGEYISLLVEFIDEFEKFRTPSDKESH